MAKVVLGFATSHGPQLRMTPDKWPLLLEKDTNDPRFDYQALLARDLPGIADEITQEKFDERYAACHRALGVLKNTVAEVAPDVIVVIGDDQHEQFLEDNMPMFSVYYGDDSARPRAPRPQPRHRPPTGVVERPSRLDRRPRPHGRRFPARALRAGAPHHRALRAVRRRPRRDQQPPRGCWGRTRLRLPLPLHTPRGRHPRRPLHGQLLLPAQPAHALPAATRWGECSARPSSPGRAMRG